VVDKEIEREREKDIFLHVSNDGESGREYIIPNEMGTRLEKGRSFASLKNFNITKVTA